MFFTERRLRAVKSVRRRRTWKLPAGLISPLNRVSPVGFRRDTVGCWRGNSTYAASCGNVSVQGPEICFPKHASCDFTQHCLAQHPAYWFLEISCEKRTNPEPLPLSSCAVLDSFFIRLLCVFLLFSGGWFCFVVFLRPDYVAPQSARSMTKDFF